MQPRKTLPALSQPSGEQSNDENPSKRGGARREDARRNLPERSVICHGGFGEIIERGSSGSAIEASSTIKASTSTPSAFYCFLINYLLLQQDEKLNGVASCNCSLKCSWSVEHSLIFEDFFSFSLIYAPPPSTFHTLHDSLLLMFSFLRKKKRYLETFSLSAHFFELSGRIKCDSGGIPSSSFFCLRSSFPATFHAVLITLNFNPSAAMSFQTFLLIPPLIPRFFFDASSWWSRKCCAAV